MKVLFVLLFVSGQVATAKELIIFHDADYSVNATSAKSMKMGFLTALDEVGNDFSGYQLRFVEKNHRGNIKRSYKHMKDYLKSDNALFVLGGLHSPPYIKNRTFINENEILLLVPWAAGGPITRYEGPTNWVFRLSIDDTKAGVRLGQYAEQVLNCKKPHMLLENTPWGKSNFNTITNHFDGKAELGVTWFDWNTKQNVAKITLRDVLSTRSDCILLVGNYAETKAFFDAMTSFPKEQRAPFVSHWGFTGGDVNALMTKEVKQSIELSFLQSCYNFSSDSSQRGQDVLRRASLLFPEEDIPSSGPQAPAGFIHSYDLGKLVFSALKQLQLSGNIKQDRAALRAALESQELTARGLIKDYKGPFKKWSKAQSDAHEALDINDFCMAKFGDYNQILTIPNK